MLVPGGKNSFPYKTCMQPCSTMEVISRAHCEQRLVDIGHPALPGEKKPEQPAAVHNGSSFLVSKQQNQFGGQGDKLVPECPAEQAMMYQRMFEGLALNQKMGTLPLTCKVFLIFSETSVVTVDPS